MITTLWMRNPGAQDAIWDAWLSHRYRYMLLEGGFRSSKTWSGARLLVEAMIANRCCDGLAAGTSYQLIEEVMYPELERVTFDAGLRPRWHAAKRVLELRALRNPKSRYNRHAVIKCRSAEKAQRIEGIECGAIWADERGRWMRFPQDPKRDGAKQLKGRLSDKRARYPIQIDTGTPEGTATSTYEEYHENPSDQHVRFTMPTRENATNLDPDFIRGLESSYDDETLQQYRDGIPTDVGVGFAYRGYTAANRGHTHYRADQPLYIMLDFNVELLPLVYGQPQGEPPDAAFHVLGEVINRGGAQTAQVVEEFCTRFPPTRHGGLVYVFGDATGDSRDTRGTQDDWLIVRRTLEACGYGPERIMWCVPDANPDVRQRVLRVRAMFRDGTGRVRIVLDPEQSPVLDKDFRSVLWTGDGDLDKRDKLLTHASDALGYMAHIVYAPVVGSSAVHGAQARILGHDRGVVTHPAAYVGARVKPW